MRNIGERAVGTPARPARDTGLERVTISDCAGANGRAFEWGGPGVALTRGLAEPIRAGVRAATHAVDADTRTDAVRLVELGVCASAVVQEDSRGLAAPPDRGRVQWHARGLTVIARDLADLVATVPLVGQVERAGTHTEPIRVGAHSDSIADTRMRDRIGDVAARLSLGGVPVVDLDAERSPLFGGLLRRVNRASRADIDVVVTSVPPPDTHPAAGTVVSFPSTPDGAGDHVQVRAREGVAGTSVLDLLRSLATP
ncbi:hypothetical protein GIY23_04545 [Allosaccharopolyspora coralli]|uniref:Uncharacterized protein n=1 Tax=Allosaccharopolyspora coralli TaxID=2665642 RepID=A0A5Q3QBQ9_9PSEU|nr:hypothetical protein [Allosaccharopolyspora coralli]QGK68905.1 hypothetical protein GIY23_04545 [Allosaccharopolyspora coralli]